MISMSTARKVAQGFVDNLNQTTHEDGLRFVLLSDGALEHEACWTFQYNTDTYSQTRQFKDIRLGVVLLVVDKRDGTLYLGPSTNGPDFYADALGRDDFNVMARAEEYLQPKLASRD